MIEFAMNLQWWHWWIAAAVFDLLAALGAPGLEELAPPVPRLRLRTPSGRTVEQVRDRIFDALG